MRKSEIIAACLVNTGVGSVEEAEATVRKIFQNEFPGQDFDRWNADVHDSIGRNIVKVLDTPSGIDVKRVIEELFL